MRAIAEKLIPGIHPGIRIAILQQTRNEDTKLGGSGSFSAGDMDGASNANISQRTVLEEVVEKAVARNSIQQEIDSKQIIDSSL